MAITRVYLPGLVDGENQQPGTAFLAVHDNGDGTVTLKTTGGGGGGATIPNTTNLIAGDGAGNGADSGIVPANVTTQGNTFNGASQLVQLDEDGALPTGLAFLDPGVAHFTSIGGGNGTPNNPYGPGDGQTAYTAGFRVFYIGPGCNIGDISLAADLYFYGMGSGAAVGFISTPDASDFNLFVFGTLTISGANSSVVGFNGGGIAIYGDNSGSIIVSNINTSGGAPASGDGLNGGAITLLNVLATTINRSGSDAATGSDGNGGNTGNLTLLGTGTFGTETNTPGNGDGGGGPGTLGLAIRDLSRGVSVSSSDNNSSRTLVLQPAGNATVTIPSGTSTTIQADTGWTANADGGDKTKSIGSNASLAAMEAALNVVLAGFGTSYVATAEKVKALETALVAKLYPNA